MDTWDYLVQIQELTQELPERPTELDAQVFRERVDSIVLASGNDPKVSGKATEMLEQVAMSVAVFSGQSSLPH